MSNERNPLFVLPSGKAENPFVGALLDRVPIIGQRRNTGRRIQLLENAAISKVVRDLAQSGFTASAGFNRAADYSIYLAEGEQIDSEQYVALATRSGDVIHARLLWREYLMSHPDLIDPPIISPKPSPQDYSYWVQKVRFWMWQNPPGFTGRSTSCFLTKERRFYRADNSVKDSVYRNYRHNSDKLSDQEVVRFLQELLAATVDQEETQKLFEREINDAPTNESFISVRWNNQVP